MQNTWTESEKTSLWTKDFMKISAATFLIFCGFQILMPTLPKFAASLGADKTLIGLINGVFTISSLTVRPYIGRECDLRGRKGIYLMGLIVFFLAVFGYIWASTLTILLLLRIIHGIGWAATTTAAGTMVADIIPPSRRGEGMGYYGMFSTLAMALAPALGLAILVKYDFSILFIISLLLTTGALLAGQAIKTPPPAITDTCREKSLRPSFFDRRALKVSVLMFFLTLTYGGIVTFLPLYAEERGILNIGPFFTIYALSLMVTRPLAGKLYDKRGPTLIVIPGLIMVALSTSLLSQSTTFLNFLICGVLYGLGFGSLQPTFLAMAIRGIEPQRRGSVNALVFSAFDLGLGTGSLALGAVASFFSYSTMYLVSTLAPFLGLLVYLLWPHEYALKEKTPS